VEVVASLSQGRTAAAQCGLFTHKSVPVIFKPPCSRLREVICVWLCDSLQPNFAVYYVRKLTAVWTQLYETSIIW